MLPEIESSGIEVGWRDGGYYYQSKYKVRTFKLRCFFEDATPEDLNRIVLWLSKDSCGKLVFDERKDVYYIVRPTGTTEFSAYPVRHEWMNQDTYSGTFVAVLTAHDPLGFMELTSLSEPSVTTDYTYSGIMDDNMMPSSPSLSDTYFLVYNCGTHPCDMTIDIAGSAPSGLTIRNLSNGTSCKIVGLPSDGALHIDGQLGKVTVITEGNETDAFDLHDEGYITLSPYENIYRDLLVQTAEGSNALKVCGCPINEG